MYEGGYTSAVNSASTRDVQGAQAAQLRQQVMMALAVMQQQEEQRQRRETARAGLGNMLPQLAGLGAPPPGMAGPQPPAPGASSPPMIHPSAGGEPQQLGAMPPPPGPGFATPGGPAPMGAMPPPPGPGFASPPPAAPPAGASMPPGAGSGAPMGAGGPPGAAPPPQGWRPLPGPPPGAGPPGAPGGGPPGEQAVMPRQMVSVGDLAKLLASKGIKGSQALDMIEEWKPYMDADNKRELDHLKLENQAQSAAMRAYAQVLTANASATRAQTGVDRLKQNAPLVQAKIDKLRGGQPGKPDIYTPDAKEHEDDKLRIQAWQYIEKGTLPYRKGTGGGKDANEKVMGMVANIAKEMGMSPQEIVAQPADWKANASSLAFQTKKLDAIQGTLNSFHNNLDTWDNLAKGIPPELGGPRVKAFAKDLEKINFTGIRSFDEMKLKVQQQFNDPSVAAMMVAAMAAAMDYARIMQGPQSIASLTEGARHDAERLVNAAADDKARAGIMAALESDTEGQVKGVSDQLDAIRKRMGMKGGKGALEPRAPGAGAADYVEIRKAADGRTLGRKADGTIEEIKK